MSDVISMPRKLSRTTDEARRFLVRHPNGMALIVRAPAVVPIGLLLAHEPPNCTTAFGTPWLQTSDGPAIEVCLCGRWPSKGRHYALAK
jgi:hypothetical protein